MILTSHLLAGAVIATKIKNPVLAFPLALMSHYLLDILPHREYRFNNWQETKKIIKNRDWKNSNSESFRIFLDGVLLFLDAVFGLSIILLIFSQKTPPHYLWLGVLGGVFPDILTGIHFLFPKNSLLEKHFRYHESIQFLDDEKVSFIWGTLTQLVVVVSFILYLS